MKVCQAVVIILCHTRSSESIRLSRNNLRIRPIDNDETR